MKNGSLKPSFDHAKEANGIPLPATLIHDLSKQLEKRDTRVALYSAFPFPVRGERKLDDFQHDTWQALSADPDALVYRRVEGDGRPMIRVAIADRIVADACVNCHNTHPASPKTDWKLGDVRGVLEVASFIDGPLAAGGKLSETIILAVIGAGVLLTLISLILAHRVAGPVDQLAGAISALGAGDTTRRVDFGNRRDEIGTISRALDGLRHSLIEVYRLKTWSRGEARWLGPCGHHSVSSPRSSNRTCGFPASGFPTGFTSRHTAVGQDGPDFVGSHRAPRTRPYRGNLVPRDDTLWRLTKK